jgi:hypothetical protein
MTYNREYWRQQHVTTNITEIEDADAIFAQSLNEEDKRGVSESLTEEELAIFDILTRPNKVISHGKGDCQGSGNGLVEYLED